MLGLKSSAKASWYFPTVPEPALRVYVARGSNDSNQQHTLLSTKDIDGITKSLRIERAEYVEETVTGQIFAARLRL